MSYFHQDSIFWVEVDKIRPNPFQPRREFNEEELQSLANSIRQYGVLQALVVTRQEVPKSDGGLSVEYELISGERRLRASKLAGVNEVPVLIRSGDESDLMKLELAIIENLQREDLNVVERARAFEKLAKEFSFNKAQIARKVGKSREYVSNTMRVLSLPEDILEALSFGKISEGHARPLLMLVDRPDERQTLFKEIIYKKISVREAERIAKKIAKERVRKPSKISPELEELEKKFTESLGTRVYIQSKEVGGKILIDYFSDEDLHSLLEVLKDYKKQGNAPMLESFLEEAERKEREKMSSEANVNNEENEQVENSPKEHFLVEESEEHQHSEISDVNKIDNSPATKEEPVSQLAENETRSDNVDTDDKDFIDNERPDVVESQPQSNYKETNEEPSNLNEKKTSSEEQVLSDEVLNEQIDTNTTSEDDVQGTEEEVSPREVNENQEEDVSNKEDNKEEDLYSVRNFTV